MSTDYKKLQAFVEAATSNPKHPIYALGMRHSPILQRYAVNVQMLGAVAPEQWFKDYPADTAKLEEVMKLCEEDEAELAREAEKSGADRTRVLTLEAQVAKLTETVAKLTAGKTDATTTETAAGGDGGATGASDTVAGADEDEPFDGLEDEDAK